MYVAATTGTSWKSTNPTIQGDAKRRPRSTERCIIRGLLVAADRGGVPVAWVGQMAVPCCWRCLLTVARGVRLHLGHARFGRVGEVGDELELVGQHLLVLGGRWEAGEDPQVGALEGVQPDVELGKVVVDRVAEERCPRRQVAEGATELLHRIGAREVLEEGPGLLLVRRVLRDEEH